VRPGVDWIGAEGQVVGDLRQQVGERAWDGGGDEGECVLWWAAGAEAGGEEIDR
jgi:hypothetical protein